jgi:trimethylamine--corrinoid protein Co-methyltransferase
MPLLKVLSDFEIKQIHDASIDILVNCGVKVLSGRMLDFLKGKGLEVDSDTRIVRFTKRCIEDNMSKIPETFDVYNRDGEFAYVMGDRKPKIAAGHNAVFWVDPGTGETRECKTSDIVLFSKICEELERIDMIGLAAMPQDMADPQASLLYGVRAMIENSTKPIYFSTDTPRISNACIEMTKAAFKGNMKDHVYGILQLSPTSPLFWEENVIDMITDAVETDIPITVLPEPIAGFSSPYTLAGLLTMDNTECLAGLVMIQMLKPGHKVMYANSWTTTDMNSGCALVGSTETTICRIAAAQLAMLYKVPSHTTAPNSDNHAHDEQNSWEKTLSQFCSITAGHDLIVNCGMFATGMTYSNEQLLMDEEISAMSERIAAGVNVTKETIAADLIKKIGPQGDTYLTTDHTLEWLRTDEYVKPRLSVSGPHAVWQQKGGKDTYQIAKEKVKEYEKLEPKPFEADRKAALDEIVKQFEAESAKIA